MAKKPINNSSTEALHDIDFSNVSPQELKRMADELIAEADKTASEHTEENHSGISEKCATRKASSKKIKKVPLKPMKLLLQKKTMKNAYKN